MDKGTASDTKRLHEELCRIMIEAYHEYQEEVVNEDMEYDIFVVNFIATRTNILSDKAGAYAKALQVLTRHSETVNRFFRLSFFSEKEAVLLLDKVFDGKSRKDIDHQLAPVRARYACEGVLQAITDCANSIFVFEMRLTPSDMHDILCGCSQKDYPLHSVSFFAFLMKELECRGLAIRYWQSMVVRYSRLLYDGHSLDRRTLSSTIHSLGFQRRQLWQYDKIEEMLDCIAGRH